MRQPVEFGAIQGIYEWRKQTESVTATNKNGEYDAYESGLRMGKILGYCEAVEEIYGITS